jgi:hypothetical protein
MPTPNNAYYMQKKHAAMLRSFVRALEDAQAQGATKLSFPSDRSYTFTAFRETNSGWEACHFMEPECSVQFRTSAKWVSMQCPLPEDVDDVEQILYEEMTIAQHCAVGNRELLPAPP